MADPFFGPGYIDVDEWRDTPLRHRYVHGGFEGTDTRFSFYFPPPEQYEGRMLHTLEGGSGGSENTATGPVGFGSLELAFSRGAYVAESNQGHFGEDLSGLRGESSVLGWRASAESARFSKQVAAEMYGAEPHHSYVFGGSGGGIRSLLCMENVDDVWDGAVPFMFPHQMTLEFFSTQLNAVRVLGPKQLASVADAMEVGGSGDPFEGLNTEQREALAALYRTGFPHGPSLGDEGGQYVWTWNASWLTAADPGYFEDFWSLPGYVGADAPDTLAASLIEAKTTVRRVVKAGELASSLGSGPPSGMASMMALRAAPDVPLGVVVDGVEDAGDPERLVGATLKLTSGRTAGREIYCLGLVGDVLVGSSTGELFEDVAAGDEILIDNRKFLAFCYYDRHQAMDDFPEHRQYQVDGRPIYPQRARFNIAEALHGWYTYRFSGKMIALQNVLDRGAWPCGAVRYHERVRANLGDATDEQFRLWWTDSASHMPASMQSPDMLTRGVDYVGCVQQAVRDLIDWVENGKEPPATSGYRYSEDGKLTLAPTSAERGMIQPVVTATANGGIRAEVKVGEPVRFEANAEVPPGTGTVISAEWDFEGTGTWPLKHDEIDGSSPTVGLTASHTFKKPGTYFPAIRVTSHRHGDVNASLCRVSNLGRVRVVVLRGG